MKKTGKLIYSYLKKISFTIRWRKSFLLLSCCSLFLLLFNACKDENELGLDLLPSDDYLLTILTDTNTVISITEMEDSLASDELSLQLLGSYTDPDFGLANASVYTHANLQGTPSFGVSPVTDSIVLILAYAGYYGDTSASQQVTVYSMTEDMRIDSTYFSSRNFAYDPNPLGSLNYLPRPATRVPVGNDTLIPQIRIRLNNSLGDSILSLNGQATLSSNASWLSWFKGLYLKSDDVPVEGAISYFSFFSSKMTLYYHDTSNVALTYDFSLAGARVNNFYHNFNGSPVGAQLQDPTVNDSINYLQSMSGVKTKISFPFLKHFLDSGNILINRAELKIDIQTPVVYPYLVPDNLLLVTKDANGTIVFPIDYFEATGAYGGNLNSTGDGYTFNISRHLQRYLDGAVPNADFYLVVSGSGVEATRTIIRSGKHPTSRMKLSLYYTKLN